MQVGALEQAWVCVELEDGVRVVVDFDVSSAVHVSLHWAHHYLDGPRSTRPYNCEATVRYTGTIDRPLVIEDVLAANDQKSCEVCPVDTTPALASDVPEELVELYFDLLAGLPREHRYWAIGDGETSLWRGRLDTQGFAVIEHMTPDDRLWAADHFEVVALVPVDLPPPPS